MKRYTEDYREDHLISIAPVVILDEPARRMEITIHMHFCRYSSGVTLMVQPSIFPPEMIPNTFIRLSTDGDGDGDGDDGGFLYFSRRGTPSIGGGVLSRYT